MALKDPRPWLVAYDITEPARLRRVHRFMCRQGLAQQYSVFLVEMTPLQARQMRETLQGMVDARTDDVRMYALPQRYEMDVLGRSRSQADGWALV